MLLFQTAIGDRFYVKIQFALQQFINKTSSKIGMLNWKKETDPNRVAHSAYSVSAAMAREDATKTNSRKGLRNLLKRHCYLLLLLLLSVWVLLLFVFFWCCCCCCGCCCCLLLFVLSCRCKVRWTAYRKFRDIFKYVRAHFFCALRQIDHFN